MGGRIDEGSRTNYTAMLGRVQVLVLGTSGTEYSMLDREEVS